MKSSYSRADLESAIRSVGIARGDTLSLQVSLGRLGLMHDYPVDFAAIANAVIDTFLDVIGTEGTLLVPTYTYSIGRGQTFDVANTPSAIGDFPEIFRHRSGVLRSRDPMMSNAALGAKAKPLLQNIARTCYGEGSTFDRLRQHGGKICTLGVSLYWATFRHHIEEMAQVPFRFNKTFKGMILENNVLTEESWLYFAAPLGVSNCEPNGLPLERIARDRDLVRIASIGRGEIMVIDAQTYYELGISELEQNPWLTAKGPPISIDEYIKRETSK
jgi:aminoglycoside 3-N-acetyltransferase